MVMQFLLGIPMEMAHGSLRVGTIYVLGATGGGLAWSAIVGGGSLTGASGTAAVHTEAIYCYHTTTLISIVRWCLCSLGGRVD